MSGLLADEHADAHLRTLVQVCNGPRWRDIWTALNVHTYGFADFKLAQGVSDLALWQFCQAEGLLLVTANRNGRGSDSLDVTIRTHGIATSLPVLTIADERLMLVDRSYAERAGIRLLEILLEPDRFLGTGRLFLPAVPA